jgi:hypothetical protein
MGALVAEVDGLMKSFSPFLSGKDTVWVAAQHCGRTDARVG